MQNGLPQELDCSVIAILGQMSLPEAASIRSLIKASGAPTKIADIRPENSRNDIRQPTPHEILHEMDKYDILYIEDIKLIPESYRDSLLLAIKNRLQRAHKRLYIGIDNGNQLASLEFFSANPRSTKIIPVSEFVSIMSYMSFSSVVRQEGSADSIGL